MARFALFSRHIVLATERQPVCGVLCIDDGFITQLTQLRPDATFSDARQTLDPNWDDLIDYTDQYISPGIIDMNVQCNGIWDTMEALTKQAVSGGVTLMLAHPNIHGHQDRSDALYCDVGHLISVGDSCDVGGLDGSAFGYKAYLTTPSFAISSVTYPGLQSLVQTVAATDDLLVLDLTSHNLRKLRDYSPFHSCMPDARARQGSIKLQGTQSAVLDECDDESSQSEDNSIEFFSMSLQSTQSLVFIQEWEQRDAQSGLEAVQATIERQSSFGAGDKIQLPAEIKRDQKFKTLHEDLDERIRKEAASIETHARAEEMTYEGSGRTRSKSQVTKPTETVEFEFDAETQAALGATTPAQAISVPNEQQDLPIASQSLPIGGLAAKIAQRQSFRLKLSPIWTTRHEPTHKELPKYVNWLAQVSRRPQYHGFDQIKTVMKANPTARLHLCNIAEPQVITKAYELRETNQNISVEVAMHHLAKCEEDIQPGDTNFKTYPPIRQKTALNLLWDCLKLGEIDNIASGHSKICPRYKFREIGDFTKAIPGIDGIGFQLQSVWSVLKIPLLPNTINYEKYIVRLFKFLATNPARILRVGHIRGQIAEGYLADLMIWQPEAQNFQDVNVESDSPYVHDTLKGAVNAVYLRGRLVYRHGEFVEQYGQQVTPRTY